MVGFARLTKPNYKPTMGGKRIGTPTLHHPLSKRNWLPTVVIVE